MDKSIVLLVVTICGLYLAVRLLAALPSLSPPIRDVKYRATLILEPEYHPPGNLVQRLSTQPKWEADTYPNRITILDYSGQQHSYKVYYDKRYLPPQNWPPPSANQTE